MKLLQGKRNRIITAAVFVALLAGWWLWLKLSDPKRGMVYSSRGYGAYAPADSVGDKPKDPLSPAVEAYNAGHYKRAEAEANRIIEASSKSKNLKTRKRAVQARYLLAFSAARMKKMPLARDRFDTLRKEAAKLPDNGAQAPQPGVASPTLEEEGAYQHAVCTAAMGDKKAAEAGYTKFMKDYPESPLLGSAAARIEKLHSGRMPAEAEAVWAESNRIARVRQEAREKAVAAQLSLCGPECLTEVLRMRGTTADTKALAKEMRTSDRGTSLRALADAANKRGLSAKGLSLTPKGLAKQSLPLIALIAPGHYVVVQSMTAKQVIAWDPSGAGLGKPATLRHSTEEWKRMWGGMALVFEDKTANRVR